ncbi:MAG: menaquinol-cytochrome c reductase cytochrome b subunit [Thermogutta sp.]|nr:MAG: menaquinol-cytochrome c reductase cytochrome b subunit [Thermogutta sp.]
MGVWHRIRQSRVYRSIFRVPLPRTTREKVLMIFNTFVLHVHPVGLPRYAVRLRYTWCMGGLAFFLFLVEIVTGVALMFYYRPVPEYAYADILDLRHSVYFGIMRELHRWAGHAMVVVVMLHMLRVFLTGSYRPPREFNWVIGVSLLILTLLLSFTGYLLPWDQLAYWATTVGTNMVAAAPFVGHQGPGSELLTLHGEPLITRSSDLRYFLLGSDEIGPAALNRFYIWHCIALPLAMAFLCGLHFWRVRKDGGISGPL